MASIVLKQGREKSLLRRHPWVFSGAIAEVKGDPQAGETVEVVTSKGDFIARGAYSPHSQITVRIWMFDPNEEVSASFFLARLEQALHFRQSFMDIHPDSAGRLVYAESDGLPGIIVDRYSDFLVCQFLTAGAEYWRQEIVDQLRALMPLKGIYERSDPDVRTKEGLTPRSGLLTGQMPPDLVMIQEGPCRFWVDIQRGQKTGFYLDQRENRAFVAAYSRGTEVLNCFAYSGAFGIRALNGGAIRVTNVDSSSAALDLAKRNGVLNGFGDRTMENIEGDVFHVLRSFRDSSRQFDLIILDPPKFADSRSQLERASRGYKDINLLAFKLLRPGGLLFTFSCSGAMPTDLFQKIVADAALDAEREAQIIRFLAQAPDHPTGLHFPEGRYLKGLVCRVR
jgi:23S rRNA (cytosine1962-C5)-methyltransferase